MSAENTINQIMWGAHFCSVLSGQDKDVLLVIKSPSLKDRCFVEFIHKKALQEAADSNILTEFELRSRLKAKGIWDENKEEYIETALDRIKELENVLKDCKKGERRYRVTAGLIKNQKKILEAELRRKSELFYVTAEQYADYIKNRAVVYCCAYNEFEEKFWSTWEEFQKEKDVVLIGNIAEELNKIDSCDHAEIRRIARSPDWRYMWTAAKGNIQALFGVHVGEFDIDQRNLTYWSQVYDSVYDAYERPEDEIINDDEALDKWFEEQSRKSRKERLEKSGKSGKLKVSSNVRRHGEVFIITNPEMNPDTPYRKAPDVPTNEDVENLNSNFVREFKRNEQQQIKEKKMISEKDLRSRNNRIARKVIGSNDAVIGNRNHAGKASGKSRIVPGGTL